MGSRLEARSSEVRKRIENHIFDNEEGEEYGGSSFGGFGDYFRRKKIKLQNLDSEIRAQSGDNPSIFRGVVAHVNGYTQPSLNDLHKLIVSYGGGFLQYLDGKTMVTHIIASNLTPKKAVEFRRYRIVKPAWIVDSIKAGSLLPWNEYRVLHEGPSQKVLKFDNGRVTSQVNVRSSGYRDQTENSWYTADLRGEAFESLGSKLLRVEDRTRTAAERARPEDTPLPSVEQDSGDPETPGIEDIEIPDEFFDEDFLDPTPRQSPHVEFHPHSPIPDDMDSHPHSPVHDDPGANRSEPAHEPWLDPPKNAQLTAEEHNAILLADPNVRKSTVVNPGFLEQYYRESRLHHLSTWKADLKSQLQVLAAEKSSSQKARHKRPAGSRRYIMHVDFDCFFAAVSLKKHPQFRDKPAVVAHGNGSSSEIASCNYPARKFGITNGSWMKGALALCPDLKILPYDFPGYEESSRAFYDAILGIGAIVQSVSIDEALVDISSICIAAGGSDGKRMEEDSLHKEQAKADEIAHALRLEIKTKTECDVSVGIGPNILLAKVALRKAKPAGQYQIKPDEMLDFIGILGVRDLPGVAWSIGGKLEEMGIKFVKDIRETSKERLLSALGPKTGEKLWEYSRGIDRTEVGEQATRKSVSAEVNWGVRFVTQAQVDEFMESLCGELTRRLLKEGVKGRQLTVKVMRRAADAPLDPPKHLGHGRCNTFNKSIVLGISTNATEILTRESISVVRGFGFSPGELRGLGVQMTKLEPIKSGGRDASQRQLQFKASEIAPKPIGNTSIFETIGQPGGSQGQQRFKFSQGDSNNLLEQEDPIQDDEDFPAGVGKQPLSDHANPVAHKNSGGSPKKLQISSFGTQFIIPTQVDPHVLAELPADVRAKLTKVSRPSSPSPAFGSSKVINEKSYASGDAMILPNQSQLDPEALSALPEDIRAEVLGYYQANTIKPQARAQTVLPSSPRGNRMIPAPKKLPIPTVKRRGRPPKNSTVASASISAANATPTLTQTNFLNSRPGDVSGPAAIDPAFLAALPSDIRNEVLAQQRRERPPSRSALGLPAGKRRRLNKTAPPRSRAPSAPVGLSTFMLPARPRRPTFTMQGLSGIEELREAVRAWWAEFREDGPYEEDVGALCKYLHSVVVDERDMDKARKVVGWLEWVVDEGFDGLDLDLEEEEVEKREGKWKEAVRKVKNAVQEAVQERRLGQLHI